jgi:hypothetical protein
MAHHEESTENLSHDEIMYKYHMQRGMDFTKIDLFLSARTNYELALKYRPGDHLAAEKASACTGQIRKDRKKVLTVLPFVLALITLVILLNV